MSPSSGAHNKGKKHDLAPWLAMAAVPQCALEQRGE
jgi:hypothetical protein